KMKFLILPLTSESCPDYIFLGIMDKTIDIIEYLVLSIISNMGVSALENIILFKESRKLTQERERNRLARELHDGLDQILASTQIYLHFLEKSIVSPTQDSREILQKIKSLNTLGLEESRFILSELKGKPVSSHKFQEKAKEVVELFTIPGLSIKTDFQVHINDLPYGACKMLILILQEGLSNIQKHSQASEVRVQIANTDHSISLTIQDNGVGFDQHLLDQKGDEHFGLSNLRERVRLLRGSFLVCSHPGGGTRIEVRIPFEEREENKRVGVKRT
ncbi:MAG: sensor histidine kinase, partial [Atribacterota bacterium]